MNLVLAQKLGLPEHLFSSIGSQIEASAFVWIIRVSTISQLKTDIRYLSSGNPLIDLARQGDSPNWI